MRFARRLTALATSASIAAMPAKPKAKTTKTAAAKKPSKKAPASVKANAKPAAKRQSAVKASSDWRVATLDRMRALIVQADPQMVEERKWVKPTKPLGVPVWSHGGIVCTGETYKAVVKLTFMYGARLPDPAGLFNASLEGGTRRAIDIPEGQAVDAAAFKALVRAAVTYNLQRAKKA